MPELRGASLVPLLTWRPGDPGPRPGFGGSGEDLSYMQGTVIAWSAETAENIIRIRGADHTNVPLIDLGIGQRVMQPGDQVAIMAWSPNGGTAAYFIMGRLVVPGTQAAQRSEQALASLVEQLAPAVIAARIHSATAVGQINPGVSFALDAPSISGIEVSAARRILIFISANITSNFFVETPTAGLMGFQLSGASSISPSAGRALVVGGSDPDDTVGNMHVSGTKVILLTAADGINEGTHTIQAAYQAGSTSTGSQLTQRNLTVIAF